MWGALASIKGKNPKIGKLIGPGGNLLFLFQHKKFQIEKIIRHKPNKIKMASMLLFELETNDHGKR